jgi:hypothetical protein
MNMKEIDAVSQITNYRNFADAANSLFYSSSGITKYISNVESELGIKLFERGNKSNEVSLTSDGKVIMQSLRNISFEYQHMLELANRLKGSYDNVIRIGSQMRVANVPEMGIISKFWSDNPEANMQHVKMTGGDLMPLLHAGKLDAIMISTPENYITSEYLASLERDSNAEITLLAEEKEMYLGISDEYMPGVKEAPFREFRDFSFAFAFPACPRQPDMKLRLGFEMIAKENGFDLKPIHCGSIDSAIMKTATIMPVAVPATTVTIQFPGIKFVKVADWHSSTFIYFICLKTNRSIMLSSFKKVVAQYIADR